MNPFKEYVEVLECAHMGNEFEKFQEAFNNHERVIILGNGGSSSVASHISQDYMKFRGKKVSILSDPSMLTMLTNDFKYENAYQKFLEYYVEKAQSFYQQPQPRLIVIDSIIRIYLCNKMSFCINFEKK